MRACMLPATTANGAPSRSVSIAAAVAFFASIILVAGYAIEPEQSTMMTCAGASWPAGDPAGPAGTGDPAGRPAETGVDPSEPPAVMVMTASTTRAPSGR